MRSWHDYHLTGYSVDGAKRRITLNVSWPYDTPVDINRAIVVFCEVEGYFFEHDLRRNILYSIAETSVERFLLQQAPLFVQKKKWGWPSFWRDSVEKTLEVVTANELRCFEISASYGLSGWILASTVEQHEAAT